MKAGKILLSTLFIFIFIFGFYLIIKSPDTDAQTTKNEIRKGETWEAVCFGDCKKNGTIIHVNEGGAISNVLNESGSYVKFNTYYNLNITNGVLNISTKKESYAFDIIIRTPTVNYTISDLKANFSKIQFDAIITKGTYSLKYGFNGSGSGFQNFGNYNVSLKKKGKFSISKSGTSVILDGKLRLNHNDFITQVRTKGGNQSFGFDVDSNNIILTGCKDECFIDPSLEVGIIGVEGDAFSEPSAAEANNGAAVVNNICTYDNGSVCATVWLKHDFHTLESNFSAAGHTLLLAEINLTKTGDNGQAVGTFSLNLLNASHVLGWTESGITWNNQLQEYTSFLVHNTSTYGSNPADGLVVSFDFTTMLIPMYEASNETQNISMYFNQTGDGLVTYRISFGSKEHATGGNRPSFFYELQVDNSVPTLASASINETNATFTTTAEQINVSVIPSDTDGDDVLNMTAILFVNRAESKTLQFVNIASSAVSIVFNDTNIVKNDVVGVQFNATDGTDNSDYLNATEVTVGNAIPTLASALLNYTNASLKTTGEQINFSIIVTEPDGVDVLNGTAIFFVNRVQNITFQFVNNVTGASSFILSDTNIAKGDVIGIQFNYSDGTDTSAYLNATEVTVGNLAPTISTPTINYTNATLFETGEQINATITLADLDLADTHTVTAILFVNRVENISLLIEGGSDGTSPSIIFNDTNISADDVINIQFNASDGTDISSYLNTTHITALLADTINPNVTILNFSNNTIIERPDSTNFRFTLFFNISDVSDISSCSLYRNNVLIQTNSTNQTKETTLDFTNETYFTDLFKLQVACTDLQNNVGNSTVVTLIVEPKQSGGGGGGGGGTLPFLGFVCKPGSVNGSQGLNGNCIERESGNISSTVLTVNGIDTSVTKKELSIFSALSALLIFFRKRLFSLIKFK